MKNQGYVINLHILEGCNFKCRYCFAKFGNKNMLEINIWKKIVDNILKTAKVSRFNIAGGEPLLYRYIDDLINYINSKGIKVSIITNGFLLDEKFILKHKESIDTIGISIDSFNYNTLTELGCINSNKEILTLDRFLKLGKLINNLNIKLKVNTVVNKLNYNEDLKIDLDDIIADRWKILKMKTFKKDNFNNYDLDVSINEFNYFVNKNQSKNLIIEDSMINSYIIIDSKGYLLDNSSDEYIKISDLQKEDFYRAFIKMNFDYELYAKRY
ncbi:MAG: viperin family antiviral radical SAM protein [Peptostreptococcaceae bacterium]